jgi:hypothetical protein
MNLRSIAISMMVLRFVSTSADGQSSSPTPPPELKNVTEGVATALSPIVTLLTHTATADGTCYGEKVPAVHGNSVYVRDGDTWKLAFTMNMFAMYPRQ